jgi:hypothetical protein
VFEAICGLRQLCETLTDELAAIRWRQLGTQFDTPQAAFSELKTVGQCGGAARANARGRWIACGLET